MKPKSSKSSSQHKQTELGYVQYKDENSGEIDDEIQIYHQVKDSETSPHKKFQYRPDIDGLRAVAITLVVIFHAFPEAIPGGFIGVDVFFVISGFLISGIIIKETDKQTFSYKNFYQRRIKRIYPALILIMIFTLYILDKIAKTFFQVKYYNTLIASIFFSANLQVLMNEKGYFDPDIHGNPLLHLWSLGVQEQFYIFWPFLLSFFLKSYRNKTLKIIISYTVVSFLLSIIAVYQSPKFAFYFPFCRFWQMSIGGILAYLNLKINDKKINNVLSSVGLIALLIAVWIMDDESLFPGFWALIPTLSSAFIIQARSQTLVSKYILSSAPLVFIGKISYSWYLWHWPLLVYSRTFYPSGSTSILSNLYFVVFLSFVLAVLTYYFFENPLRLSKKKVVTVGLIVAMVVIGALAFSFRYFNFEENNQFNFNEEETIKMLNLFEEEMKPGPEDYYTKGNQTHPNLSINPDRMYPTFLKIKSSHMLIMYQKSKGKEILLEKEVDRSSKYFKQNLPQEIHFYQVANQGQNDLLLLIGDSHIQRLAFRFQRLHEISIEQNKTNQFPTILLANSLGHSLTEQNQILNFTRQLVAEYKPKRMLISANWPGYVCKNVCCDNDKEPTCDYNKFDSYLAQFVNFMLEMRSKGVEVHALAVDINYWNYAPTSLVDADGIIDKNIKPFRYSFFKQMYRTMIEKYETALNKEKIPMIDITDNFCWEDQCHVITPKGYAHYLDCQHVGNNLARHWMTSLDHLVKF